MAQYSHLPIYNLAYELLKEFYQRIPKFTKQYKYLLGEKLVGANIKTPRTVLGESTRNLDCLSRGVVGTKCCLVGLTYIVQNVQYKV